MKKKIVGIAVGVLAVILVIVIAFFAGKSIGTKETKEERHRTSNTVNQTEEKGAEKQEESKAKEESGTKEAETKESEEKKESEEPGIWISYKCGNTWEQENMICMQVDVTIVNETAEEAKDWQSVLTMPKGSKIIQSWNATLNLSGTTLTAKGVEYNQNIPAGGNITYGFIMQSKETFTPLKSMVKAGGKQYEMKVKNAKEQETTDKTENIEITGEKASYSQGADSSNPVKSHGRLSVKGTNLVDEKGEAFRLKGISTHGIAWFPQYISQESFASLKNLFGINAIRLAMYSDPNAGYTKDLHAKVKEGVSAATKEGMYVIIDWHILGDGNPNTYKEQAKDFFKEMAQEYKNQDNIIYEICNEPNGGVTWEQDVRPYALELIQTIRKIDKDAVIIVGTPNWSQDVDIAADTPITGEKNIMYALHFYAATHKEEIRNKAKQALEKGLPLFVSEFSICDASGDGSLDYASADAWAAFCKENNISMIAWNLSNKAESSSLLQPSCDKVKNYQESDLSESGLWFQKLNVTE